MLYYSLLYNLNEGGRLLFSNSKRVLFFMAMSLKDMKRLEFIGFVLSNIITPRGPVQILFIFFLINPYNLLFFSENSIITGNLFFFLFSVE